MSIKITWFSHACFSIEVGGVKLLTDPFLDDNPLSPVKSADLTPDCILVSHGHGEAVSSYYLALTSPGRIF